MNFLRWQVIALRKLSIERFHLLSVVNPEIFQARQVLNFLKEKTRIPIFWQRKLGSRLFFDQIHSNP